jgi:glutaredoxin 3
MFMERSVFKMYVKAGCPYCDKARGIILRDLKCSLQLIDITHQPDLMDMVIRETGQRTVPAIYLGNEFLGGCDDLCESIESKKIEKKVLIEENGILREEILRLRRSL